MPTYWTRTLIPTLREAPADAQVPSHQLMLRAGMISKVGAGSYTYLPLGWRAVRRASQIIREEMDAAGAAEIFMPTLHPIELWQRSGRREDYGENLFVLQDRHKREYALGPTHEEVTTDLIGSLIESYKDLPKTVYQIQTKFRDEFRPRFGVLRSREFIMKDAYSFHRSSEGEGGLSETYQKQYDAYCRIFERCGVSYEIVEAESGPIGGSASHEFMVPTPTGEDTILKSDQGNYAANVEKAETGVRDPANPLEGEPTGDLQQVHTPGASSIDAVSKAIKTKPKFMLKTVVLRANEHTTSDGKPIWVLAVVRGDHELNLAKVQQRANEPGSLFHGVGTTLSLADEDLARSAGFPIGYVGPHIAVGREDVMQVFVDPDAAVQQFWVTGANEDDYHVKHFNWRRDVLDPLHHAGPESAKGRVRVANIRNAIAGDPAPEDKGGGSLRETKGIEVGHVFQLGDKYTQALGVTVLDEHNQQRTPLMGCYGIGVNRIIAAAIESEAPHAGHDEDGIIWPASLAPYDVLITPIKYEGQVKQTVDDLAAKLENPSANNPGDTTPHAGLSVLIDDRDLRPGVKFKDADLIGMPIRLTVGDKGLAANPPSIELKTRNGSLGPKGESLPLDQTIDRVLEVLAWCHVTA